jgi:hypothetical protein
VLAKRSFSYTMPLPASPGPSPGQGGILAIKELYGVGDTFVGIPMCDMSGMMYYLNTVLAGGPCLLDESYEKENEV